MNQEDLFRKLGAILNELNEQHEYLAQNPQQLNELELELFLANATFLAEHVQIIRKINNGRVQKALPEHAQASGIGMHGEEAVPEEKNEENTMFFDLRKDVKDQKPENEDVNELRFETEAGPEPEYEPERELEPKQEYVPEKELEPEYEPEREPEPQPELEIEEIEEADLDIEPLKEEDQMEIGVEPGNEDKTEFEFNTFDTPKTSLVEKEEDVVPGPDTALVEDEVEKKLTKPTLNDLLGGSLKKSNSDPALQKPAIRDLKQAINLNDKLLYIKDLFNGYNLAYAEAIELINKMPDFKSADDFLKNNYAIKNNWAAKQGTVDKFYALLNQRFTR